MVYVNLVVKLCFNLSAILFVAIVPAFAGEYAILSNGFRIYAASHEKDASIFRLHTREGVTEIPVDQVVSFEAEEYVPPPPVIAAAPAAVPSAAKNKPLSIHPKDLVDRAALRAGLPPAIVHSVAKAESGYRTEAVSPKGAIGIMQLMPATAAAYSADPKNPEQNVDAGALYLREMLLRYNGDVAKALAAYNAGPGAVDKYNGVPPYRETQNYVNKVIRSYKSMAANGESNN